MLIRLRSLLVAASVSVLVVLGFAAPAQAVTYEQKLTVVTSWTQATSASQSAWNAARVNRTPWTEYELDWSTDYCSASPDQPLGFDFRLPCYRHDFGYRNFKRLNVFPANKSHVDDAFYFDMRQVCARYSWAVRQTCLATAWTYYQAVKNFGSLVVTQAQLDNIAQETASR